MGNGNILRNFQLGFRIFKFEVRFFSLFKNAFQFQF